MVKEDVIIRIGKGVVTFLAMMGGVTKNLTMGVSMKYTHNSVIRHNF